MVDNTRRTSGRKVDARQAAREWLQRGVLTVPIGARSKRPRGGAGWNKLRITSDTVADHFNSGDNVGGLWGEPSDWIVDVDLDCPEAVAVAYGWLPSTYVYGRKSAMRSHYLYRCANLPSMKFMDGSGTVLLEVRSTGSQSVLPPSTHPSGEKYVVNVDADFTVVALDVLKRVLARVAGLALLAQSYPEGGGRHDFVCAVVGGLLRDNWSVDDVRRGIGSILVAVGDKESDVPQRNRTVENTIEHHNGGDRTYGWPTLGAWMDGRTLALVRRWLGVGAVEETPRTVKRRVEYRVPELLTDAPGLVGEVMKWSARRSYICQPVIDLSVGLMCTAVATMNRFVIGGWNTPLQPYMMVMAPTAGGKESGLRSVYEFCRRLRLGPFCFQGFQSYHSMLDRLEAEPHMAIWLWDEAARKLKSAGRSPGSPDYAVMSYLLQLYGQANAHVPGLTARGMAVPPLDHPYLAVMAASQPAALMEAVTEADLATGVINRFMLFDCGDDMKAANERRDDTFPARVETLAMVMRDRPPLAGDGDGFVSINLDGAAYARFKAFGEMARERAIEGDVWGRANQNALIVAGVIAAGMGGDRPMIDDDIAEWAITLAEWSLARWTVRLSGAVARTRTEGQSKMVEQLIARARKTKIKIPRESQRALLAAGKMPRSVLVRLCRHLTARELDSVLEMLVAGDVIGTGEDGGMTVYWCK